MIFILFPFFIYLSILLFQFHMCFSIVFFGTFEQLVLLASL